MKNLKIFDNNPILTTNEWQNIYECPKKIPWILSIGGSIFWLLLEIYISIAMTAVFFFFSILMSACYLIYQEQ